MSVDTSKMVADDEDIPRKKTIGIPESHENVFCVFKLIPKIIK